MAFGTRAIRDGDNKLCKRCDTFKNAINDFTKGKGVCKLCHSLEQKKHYRKNPAKINRRNLLVRYNLTEIDLYKLKTSNDGLCGVCHKPPEENNELVIDHDHATGVVRDFIHRKCNLLLGYAKDSTVLLNSAIEYLEKHKMNYDQNDVDNLALVTWKEARGEGVEGCRAVMHVIVNRVGAKDFPPTLHGVIYQRNAFTSMSVSSDPEFNLIPNTNDAIYVSCQALALLVLAGSDEDITKGAHYYANLKNTTSGWFFRNIVNNSTEHPITATIGHHTFFK
jgi:Cell Wall Hydrolase/Recombination endonuclease VII